MFSFKTKLKPWGNSAGVVIPKKKIAEGDLSMGSDVQVTITPVEVLRAKDIFGKLKTTRPTEELLGEVDRQMDSKFF